MVFPTISIAESLRSRLDVSRNLMAMDTEEMIRAQPMDSVVVIGAATRPCRRRSWPRLAPICDCGYSGGADGGRASQGRGVGGLHDCRRLWAKFRAGEIDEARSMPSTAGSRVGRNLHGDGHCLYHGCITEALGLSLPMSATIPAPLRSAFVRGSQRQGCRRDGDGEGPRPSSC